MNKKEKEIILNYFKVFVKRMNHMSISKEEKSLVKKLDQIWKENNLKLKAAVHKDNNYSMVLSDSKRKELVSIQGSINSSGKIDYDLYTVDSIVFEMGII